MLKSVLIFLIGVMVGANIVYFVMTRGGDGAVALAAPVVTETPVPPVPPRRRSWSPRSRNRRHPLVAPSALPARHRHRNRLRPWRRSRRPTSCSRPPGWRCRFRACSRAQLADTFAEARGSDRRHDALDIMAPAGTPVLAVADGHVEKLFTSVQGGLTLYQFEPSGRYAYYYAHLQGYAPGIVEGRQLKRGEVIGQVGSTGNANPAAPHLHFAVFVLGPEKEWWKGTAINPYPLLGGRPASPQPRAMAVRDSCGDCFLAG